MRAAPPDGAGINPRSVVAFGLSPCMSMIISSFLNYRVRFKCVVCDAILITVALHRYTYSNMPSPALLVCCRACLPLFSFTLPDRRLSIELVVRVIIVLLTSLIIVLDSIHRTLHPHPGWSCPRRRRTRATPSLGHVSALFVTSVPATC